MYSVVWLVLCSTVTGQVLDVDRMISKTALGHQQDLHPVIRTLYDHADVRCLPTCALWVFCYDGNMYNCALVKNVSTVQGVVALDFHPTVSVLASGSRDCKVKFFDYSKPSAKCSYCSIPEVATARCLVFHPSGDYMLVGTEQSTCTHQTSVFTCSHTCLLYTSPSPRD